MQRKNEPRSTGKSSRRVAQDLAEFLRREIETGSVRPGNFLPSVRELMKEHGSASLTVQRALKRLEEEGLVAAEPRQGYRVLQQGAAAFAGQRVSFVLSSWCEPGTGGGFSRELTSLLQDGAEARGMRLTTLVIGRESAAETLKRVRAEGSGGIILDTAYPELAELAGRAGIGVVVVDSWARGAEFDAVVQDDFNGGQMVGEYLASRGHKRIGWLGPENRDQHYRERRGGVEIGLSEAGMTLGRSCDVDFDSGELHEAAQVMLTGKNRPTGVCALWTRAASALKEAGLEAGLKLGEDLEIVTWTTEENYEVQGSKHGSGMPTVVWSLRAMADAALSRLAARMADPGISVVRVNIPTRLVGVAGD